MIHPLHMIHPLTDAEKTESTTPNATIHHRGIKPDSIILHDNLDASTGPADIYADCPALRMLDHVGQQFSHRLEQQDTDVSLKWLGLLVIIKADRQSVLLRYTIGKCFYRHLQTEVIKRRWAELEYQQAGLLDQLLEKLTHFIERFYQGRIWH